MGIAIALVLASFVGCAVCGLLWQSACINRHSTELIGFFCGPFPLATADPNESRYDWGSIIGGTMTAEAERTGTAEAGK